MRIFVERKGSIPIYMQIRNQISELISSGALLAGSRLPAERNLARELGINRSTVVRAYEELAADGLVEARVGRGTMVSPGHSPSGPAGAGLFQGSASGGAPFAPAVSPFSWEPSLNRQGYSLQDRSLAAILNMLAGPNVISFAGGVPDPSFYPMEQVRAASREILDNNWAEALDYSATGGLAGLRQRISAFLDSQGFAAPSDQILVCSGSQQGLDMLSRVLLKPGDSVILEEPSYIGAINAFRLAGARLLGVPVDGEGMRTDILEQLLQQHQPRFIYTMPCAHNPAACTMSPERRIHLLSLASRFRLPIIEDDAYGCLYYGNEMPPLLASLDREGLVILLGSASKMLLPGLRVAWVAGPAPLVNACLLIKQVTDLHSSSFSQLLMERLLHPENLHPHLERVRGLYREKRDAMARALASSGGNGLRWNIPDGGLYFWVELPPQVDAAQLLSRTESRGVVFMPGAPFFFHGGGTNHMRLSFARHSPEEISSGIEIICQEMRALQDGSGLSPLPCPGASNLHLL